MFRFLKRGVSVPRELTDSLVVVYSIEGLHRDWRQSLDPLQDLSDQFCLALFREHMLQRQTTGGCHKPEVVPVVQVDEVNLIEFVTDHSLVRVTQH